MRIKTTEGPINRVGLRGDARQTHRHYRDRYDIIVL